MPGNTTTADFMTPSTLSAGRTQYDGDHLVHVPQRSGRRGRGERMSSILFQPPQFATNVIRLSIAIALIDHQPAGSLPVLNRKIQHRNLVALRLAK
jgi:hypothetical protein